ncbi:hypothetical protein HCUR_00082 [Holospora curviuscula]|uniref:Uncharacterized protein n=1 Tax=Holospora curviuscula TaxID=1082868 RepID=A0A2S5RHR8_9PROT|nr:hypothetical protein HCUR_00082 [Holospora curviuscula]
MGKSTEGACQDKSDKDSGPPHKNKYLKKEK